MEYSLDNPLFSSPEHNQPDGAILSLFASESDHKPSLASLDHVAKSIRLQAFSVIEFAQGKCQFEMAVAYLALNYIDRFLTNQGLVGMEEIPWLARILAFASILLAAKMRGVELYLSDLQGQGDSVILRRIEGVILCGLRWRLRSITPFSFLSFFASFARFENPAFVETIIDRASTLLYKSHYELKLLEFKQSVISAAMILYATEELIPLHYYPLQIAISRCGHVNIDEVVRCVMVIKALHLPPPPRRVVAAESGDVKRRRLNGRDEV